MAIQHRRPRGETRRTILRVAARRFQQAGYHGFTFAQIAEELEIRSSAVHYHFPGKPDLVVAIFQRYREHFAWWCEQQASDRLAPLDRLQRFLDLEARNLDGERVEPLGLAGVEYASLPASACSEAEALRDDVADWLTGVLAAGLDTGDFQFGAAPRDQARLVMAGVQGALQLARLRDARDFTAVRRALLASVGARGV
ncbi:TetR family transcriptional regulator [Spiribacter sp. 2438]|uniref:TetR/AcrR family transcriptional regulator n=1 Tax=Spiribacter sp. 2438 TaxID=2666185 RepID=UPI0012AFA0F6|nr:TetR/AcrR family transcriptional regulator [Spiribacter sp. 2438]QGM21123.1 TetR family transcriptional regulator [Spiribacter sp. 2438]